MPVKRQQSTLRGSGHVSLAQAIRRQGRVVTTALYLPTECSLFGYINLTSLCICYVEPDMPWPTRISSVGFYSDNIFIATPDSLLSERLVRCYLEIDATEFELEPVASLMCRTTVQYPLHALRADY